MVISNASLIAVIISILVIITFIVAIAKTRQIMMIHKFYFAAAIFMISWLVAMIGMKFTDPNDIDALYRWDFITTFGGTYLSPCSLLFAICYTKEFENHLPKKYWWLFAVPVTTTLMALTNPLHHLYYKVFSVQIDQIQFGPYFPIHSAYTFICVSLSIYIIVKFAVKTKTRLHMLQAILFTIGTMVPSITNLLALFKLAPVSIVATPLSFVVTLIFHGIVIFRLHMFDIRPIAMQQLINWISDSYLITNQNGLIVNYNQPFKALLGVQHNIRENIFLHECVHDEDVENKTAIYNLLSGINSCQGTHTRVTYEQSISSNKGSETTISYFMVEITPLVVKENVCGYLAIFKDVTQLKLNMQRLQDSQVKMMERERLAFLGQMVGGLAHNLKTPIMSISGSASAIENLITECEDSIGDADVTAEDYYEIYNEVNGWLGKMREACAYMSDIISAVKGQASNMNDNDGVDFDLDEALKRVSLLLRHELLNSHCILQIQNHFKDNEIILHGDINNLVQVINNLVSNAIDAQAPDGSHDITIEIRKDEQSLIIAVKDHGLGIPEKVRKSLFQQMVTSKGNLGTGLGIFISNTVIRAKFDGTMWFDDNPGGGTIMGISIPLENVTFENKKGVSVN